MNENKLITFFWLFSWMLLFIIIVISYATIEGNEIKIFWEFSNKSLDSGMYFYSLVIIVVMTNASSYALSKLLVNGSNSLDRAARLASWIIGLALIINLFLSSAVIFVSLHNRMDNNLEIAGYFIILTLLFLLAWSMRLPWILKKN